MAKTQRQFVFWQVEKKFHSLRAQFAAELKIEERRKSGSEGGTSKSKWQYMSSLLFLRRGIKRRQGACTEIGKIVIFFVLPRHFSVKTSEIFGKFFFYFPRRTGVMIATL